MEFEGGTARRWLSAYARPARARMLPTFATISVMLVIDFFIVVVRYLALDAPSEKWWVSILGAWITPALVIVLVVPVVTLSTEDTLRPSFTLLMLFYGAALCIFAFGVPNGTEAGFIPSLPARWRSSWQLRVVIVSFGLLVLWSMHSLRRRTLSRTTRLGDRAQLDQRLLPSQSAALANLIDYCSAGGCAGPPSNVALIGSWGTGKSRILSAFYEYVNPSTTPERRGELTGRKEPSTPQLVVIPVDVWRDDFGSDPTAVMIEGLASHPSSNSGFRWLDAPWHWRRPKWLRSIRLSAQGVSTEVSLDPPRLRNLGKLESRISEVRGDGNRIVFVLDELDRAGPLNMQAALTAAQRGLNAPGVTIVVSCSEEMLAHQLASPLFPSHADVESARTAALIEVFGHSFWQRYEQLVTSAGEHWPASLLSVDNRRDDDQWSDELGTRELARWELVQLALRQCYATADRAVVGRAGRRFLSKYLGVRQVRTLGARTAADVVKASIEVFPSIRDSVEAILSNNDAAPDQDPNNEMGPIEEFEQLLTEFCHQMEMFDEDEVAVTQLRDFERRALLALQEVAELPPEATESAFRLKATVLAVGQAAWFSRVAVDR